MLLLRTLSCASCTPSQLTTYVTPTITISLNRTTCTTHYTLHREINPFFFARVLENAEADEEEANPLLSTVIVHGLDAGVGAGVGAGAGAGAGGNDTGTAEESISPRLIAGSGVVIDEGDGDGDGAGTGAGRSIGRRISGMFGMGTGRGNGGSSTTTTTTTTSTDGIGDGGSGDGTQGPRPFLTALSQLVRNPSAQSRSPADLVTTGSLSVVQDMFSGMYVALHSRSDAAAAVSVAAVRRGGGGSGSSSSNSSRSRSTRGSRRGPSNDNGSDRNSSVNDRPVSPYRSDNTSDIHSPAHLHARTSSTSYISHGDEVSIELTPSPTTTIRPSRRRSTTNSSSTSSGGGGGAGGTKASSRPNTNNTSSASSSSSDSRDPDRRRTSRRDAPSRPAPNANASARAGTAGSAAGSGGGRGRGARSNSDRDSFISPRRLT